MKKSLLLCIIAAIGFGVAPTFIQLAIQSGVSQTSCVLFNNILLMLVCLVMCLAGHHSLCIPAKKVLPLLLMGACGMGFTVLLLSQLPVHRSGHRHRYQFFVSAHCYGSLCHFYAPSSGPLGLSCHPALHPRAAVYLGHRYRGLQLPARGVHPGTGLGLYLLVLHFWQ